MKKALMFKKTVLIQYCLLISLICFAGFLIHITDHVYVHLGAFGFLILGAMSIVSFDISHPYFWYSFVFMLYSVSYPIMWITGATHDIYVYTKSLMLSQWLALSTLLLVVGPARTDYEGLKYKSRSASNLRLIMLIPILAIIPTILKISQGGFTHKSEIYSEGSLLIFIGFRAVLVLLILFTINLTRACLLYGAINKKITVIVFILIFGVVYYSGERDLIIRPFVILSLVYFVLVKRRKLDLFLIFIGLFSVLLIPMLADFKYFGLTGERNVSERSVVMRLLNSEFQSASKNLQIVLLDESTKGIFQGATLISSVIRTFKMDKLLDLEIDTGIKWYNRTYFAPNRAGQGFTLVGEGYINFGYAGIVLVFVFVGILIKIIYRKSNQGVYHFSYYILSIPVFMYSIRADLANIISPLIVQNLLIMALACCSSKILDKVVSSKKP